MPKIEITLKPSRYYILCVSLIMVISVGLLLGLSIHLGLKLICCIMMLMYGAYILWRYGLLRHPDSILGLRQEFDATWMLSTVHGLLAGALCRDSTVTTTVCVLRFVLPGKRLPRSCLVFPDSVADGGYRRLLVQLRTSPLKKTKTS